MKSVKELRFLESRNTTLILAIVSLFSCFLLSVLFAELRLYTDTAYYFFHAVNRARPLIELDRWVLIFSQALPAIGSALGLPLKFLIQLNSLSLPLFAMLSGLVSWKISGKSIYLLMSAFVPLLGMYHSFFVPNFELYYGLALIVLLQAMFEENNWSYARLIALAILAFFIFTSHPLIVILVLLVRVLYSRPSMYSKKADLVLLTVFVLTLAYKSQFATVYESNKARQIVRRLISGEFLTMFSREYLGGFAGLIFKYYLDILVFNLVLLVMFLKKSKREAFFFALASMILLLLVNLTLLGTEQSRYLEQTYMYWVMFLVLALPVAFASGFRGHSIIGERISLTLLFILAMAFRISLITSAGHAFEQRKQWILKGVEAARKSESSRMVLSTVDYPSSWPHYNWSLPMESLVLSSLDGNSVSLLSEEDITFQENEERLQMDAALFLLRRWELLPIDSLNSSYFSLEQGCYVRSP